MPFTEANGVTLHYRLDGSSDGKPLVLIHELGGTLLSWESLIPPLMAAGYYVLRWDWRGSGLSEKIRGTLAVDAMCGDLAGLVDAVGFPQPVDVVGTALGGGIAIAFAAREQARVRRMVVTSPATGGNYASREMLLTRAEGVEKDGMRPFADASMARSFPPKYRTDAAYFGEYRNRWICNDPGSFACHNRMLADMDESGAFAKLTCPILVIAGTDDPLRTPEAVKAIADVIPGAEYRELATGHFMPVYSQNLWADNVLPFLAE